MSGEAKAIAKEIFSQIKSDANGFSLAEYAIKQGIGQQTATAAANFLASHFKESGNEKNYQFIQRKIREAYPRPTPSELTSQPSTSATEPPDQVTPQIENRPAPAATPEKEIVSVESETIPVEHRGLLDSVRARLVEDMNAKQAVLNKLEEQVDQRKSKIRDLRQAVERDITDFRRDAESNRIVDQAIERIDRDREQEKRQTFTIEFLVKKTRQKKSIVAPRYLRYSAFEQRSIGSVEFDCTLQQSEDRQIWKPVSFLETMIETKAADIQANKVDTPDLFGHWQRFYLSLPILRSARLLEPLNS